MKKTDLLSNCRINLYTLEMLAEKKLSQVRVVPAMMKLMRFSNGDNVTEKDLAYAKIDSVLLHREQLKKTIDAGDKVKGMSSETVMKINAVCDLIETHASSAARRTKSLEKLPPSGLFIPILNSAVDITVLNAWLVEQVVALQKNADEKRKFAFECVFGVNGESMTQSDTGKLFKPTVTGERVRRILNDAIARFVLPYPAEAIVARLNESQVLDHEISPFINLFKDRRGGLSCLEYALDLQKGDLRSNEVPKIPQNVIYHVAGSTGNRFTVDDIVKAIEEKGVIAGVDRDAIELVVNKMESELIHQRDDGTLYAAPLPDPYYAASLLYDYPEGLSVNAMSLQSANNLDMRIGKATSKSYWANVLVRASNVGMAAISEPGYYKHIRFFEDTLRDKDEIIKKTKAYLKKSKSVTVSLMHEIMPNVFPDHDYAGVRYVVSHLGDKDGIYFRGTSSIDMVSLNKDVPVLDMESEVLSVIGKRKGPLTKEDVSDAIWGSDVEHRPSVYHVIARLEERRKVVKVGKGLYQSPKNAFKGTDVDAVVTSIMALVDLMDKQNLAVEVHALNEHINSEMKRKQPLPPLWVVGFIRYHQSQFEDRLVLNNNVVAKTKDKAMVINDIGQEVLDSNPDMSSVEFIEGMQRRVVIEPKQASAVFSYLTKKR